KQLEESEKRNHIKLGKQLDLFSIHQEGPGFIFWHPKGTILINELTRFWQDIHEEENYKEIKTPIILSKELWEKSGHWEHYKDNMYFTKLDNRDFAVKPMNCPGSVLVYKEHLHSYREFPLRLAELGLVHRHELSGVLNGLFRVRSFTQDDAHIFLEESQIKDEIIKLINLMDYFYKKIFKFNYHIELSTRPKKAIGSKETWDNAESSLKSALTKKKVKYKLNEGGGAFYGPKIDFHVEDSLGRNWQLGTIQLDFSFPERFKLTYEGKDGKKHQPVIIHRTIYGSLERFIGILIEHYAGKFPLWLSPIQVKILTVTDRNNKFAQEIYKKLKENNIRVELDNRPESIGRKVRDAQLEKITYTLTLGDKEQKSKTLAVRTLDGKLKFGIKIDKFIKDILNEIQDKK
ncbi:MAG: threonine--tRNA ligase, partial [Nanoarchaeota archaeon]